MYMGVTNNAVPFPAHPSRRSALLKKRIFQSYEHCTRAQHSSRASQLLSLLQQPGSLSAMSPDTTGDTKSPSITSNPDSLVWELPVCFWTKQLHWNYAWLSIRQTISRDSFQIKCIWLKYSWRHCFQNSCLFAHFLLILISYCILKDKPDWYKPTKLFFLIQKNMVNYNFLYRILNKYHRNCSRLWLGSMY